MPKKPYQHAAETLLALDELLDTETYQAASACLGNDTRADEIKAVLKTFAKARHTLSVKPSTDSESWMLAAYAVPGHLYVVTSGRLDAAGLFYLDEERGWIDRGDPAEVADFDRVYGPIPVDE